MQDHLNILAFAYVFPPDAGSGTYRTLYFTNHWAQRGDRVTIVTVKEECFLPSALVDRGLCREVHPSTCIVRASAKRPLQSILALKNVLHRKKPDNQIADSNERSSRSVNSTPPQGIFRLFKNTITDLLSCPDEHVGWIPDAVRLAYQVVKKDHVDCIYATGGPWSCLLAALRLHKLSGIPLVLDFRDPWVSNPNMRLRTPLSRWIQKKLEIRCVRASRIVIANTEELRQDFITRYGDLDPSRFVTVTNGFENLPQEKNPSTEQFIVVHAGALYQSRNPLNFLRASAALVREGTIAKKIFRIQLVGGVSISDPAVESELRSEELRGVLEIIPRVSHAEALTRQQRASALLLIQTGFPLQVPRKLYEYLSLARPIIAVGERDGATARMLNELGAGYVADDNVDSIKEAIAALYAGWKSGRPVSFDNEKMHMYDNRYLAARIRDQMFRILRAS
ncbi:MAG: glycosyltransferase [Sulfuricaulis sp.]